MLFFFCFCLASIILVFLSLFRISCFRWSKGLNNISVDNNQTKYSCQFASPIKCHMNFFSTIIDFSYLRKIDCRNKKPSFDLVQEMWQEHLSYRDSGESFEGLAYPFTNNDKFTFNKI